MVDSEWVSGMRNNVVRVFRPAVSVWFDRACPEPAERITMTNSVVTLNQSKGDIAPSSGEPVGRLRTGSVKWYSNYGHL